jgi:hypothetical protein
VAAWPNVIHNKIVAVYIILAAINHYLNKGVAIAVYGHITGAGLCVCKRSYAGEYNGECKNLFHKLFPPIVLYCNRWKTDFVVYKWYVKDKKALHSCYSAK